MNAQPQVARRPRLTAGLVNLIAGAAVLVVVISFALRAATDQPPAVAEFAPQPQHPIQEAPQELSSQFGSGPGAAVGPPVSPSPQPSPGIPGDAVLLPCVGDPPRQIEDPQSPPCVPYWAGNNGGATHRGVTGSVINVIAPCTTKNMANSTLEQDFINFFNKRFELYDRRIQPDCQPFSNASDAPTNRAEAETAYADADFASMYTNAAEGGVYYYDALAQKGIVAAANADDFLTSSWLRSHDPYVFSYEMAADELFGNLGEWACNWLAGKPPAHAGGTIPASNPTRKFGIFFTYGNTTSPLTTQPLKQALAACGVSITGGADFELNADGADPFTDYRNGVLQLSAAGVTSVFCLPTTAATCVQVMAQAQADNYYPEWIMSSYGRGDRSWDFKYDSPPASEMSGLFGITISPRQINPLHEPWWWAESEVNPAAVNSGADYPNWNNLLDYHDLLLIASGLQMAGPDLTPESFARGLQRAQFPNPYPEPNREGRVGFAGGSHSMTTDVAVWWWSNTARPPYSDESAGAICYYDHGTRYPSGQWPRVAGDPFTGACDSGFT